MSYWKLFSFTTWKLFWKRPFQECTYQLFCKLPFSILYSWKLICLKYSIFESFCLPLKNCNIENLSLPLPMYAWKLFLKPLLTILYSWKLFCKPPLLLGDEQVQHSGEKSLNQSSSNQILQTIYPSNYISIKLSIHQTIYLSNYISIKICLHQNL